MRGYSLLCRLKRDQSKCMFVMNSGVSAVEGGLSILKSMEIQSGHSELSVISQVSAIEGCPLSGVPL